MRRRCPYPYPARLTHPHGVSLFTEVAVFPGIESDFYFRVLKSVR